MFVINPIFHAIHHHSPSSRVWAALHHLYLAGNCALDANGRETPPIYAIESWSGWVGEKGKCEQIRAAWGIQMNRDEKKAICDTFISCPGMGGFKFRGHPRAEAHPIPNQHSDYLLYIIQSILHDDLIDDLQQ